MITDIHRRSRGKSVRAALLWQVALSATFLQGCDQRGAGRAEVPESVRRMMEADFPADGQVHAQMRGQFRIEPSTIFCTYWPGYSLDTPQLEAALGKIGQKLNYRTGEAGVSKQCAQDHPVFILTRKTDNRLGKPYKLVLAVWQGEAACVGALERADGVRPGVEAHVHDLDLLNRTKNKELQDDSIAGDMADLSRACLAHFRGGTT